MDNADGICINMKGEKKKKNQGIKYEVVICFFFLQHERKKKKLPRNNRGEKNVDYFLKKISFFFN